MSGKDSDPVQDAYYLVGEAIEEASAALDEAHGPDHYSYVTGMAKLFSALVGHFAQLLPDARAEFFHHIVENSIDTCPEYDARTPEHPLALVPPNGPKAASN